MVYGPIPKTGIPWYIPFFEVSDGKTLGIDCKSFNRWEIFFGTIHASLPWNHLYICHENMLSKLAFNLKLHTSSYHPGFFSFAVLSALIYISL